MTRCPVCLGTYLKFQGHHITPICYSGPEDGPLVDLCPNCHLGIHYQAESIAGKSRIKKRYFDDIQLERAKPYIAAIIRAKLRYEGQVRESQPRKIGIEVPDYLLKRMHLRKSDKGFTNLQDYIFSLILQDVREL